jgi:hypothetical protein
MERSTMTCDYRELEELVKKVPLTDLRTEAKKHGISTSCRTKNERLS